MALVGPLGSLWPAETAETKPLARENVQARGTARVARRLRGLASLGARGAERLVATSLGLASACDVLVM